MHREAVDRLSTNSRGNHQSTIADVGPGSGGSPLASMMGGVPQEEKIGKSIHELDRQRNQMEMNLL